MLRVTMEWKSHIELNPAIQAGKPIVKGTRLTVDFVLELLANDWTEQAIRQEYPTLSREAPGLLLMFANHGRLARQRDPGFP